VKIINWVLSIRCTIYNHNVISFFLVDQVYEVVLFHSLEDHRITESENGKVWKGP